MDQTQNLSRRRNQTMTAQEWLIIYEALIQAGATTPAQFREMVESYAN